MRLDYIIGLIAIARVFRRGHIVRWTVVLAARCET